MTMRAYAIKEQAVAWIREWFEENGPNSPAVIGISGGVDSTVVAGLCVEALGPDRVKGVLMPCGEQQDINDALEVVHRLHIDYTIVNIENKLNAFLYNGTVGSFRTAYEDLTNAKRPYVYQSSEPNVQLALGNTEARIRMTTLYGISQMIGGRVSNNCNKSETFIGYSTRWGDDTGDFAPLRDMTKSDVVGLAYILGMPKHLAQKTPVDGLHNNEKDDGTYKTDEEVMGFTYEQLETYINIGTSFSEEADALIKSKHEASQFKRNPIAQFNLKGGKKQ